MGPLGALEGKPRLPQLSGVSAGQSACARLINTENIPLVLLACIFVTDVLFLVYVTFHTGALLWREGSLDGGSLLGSTPATLALQTGDADVSLGFFGHIL